MSLYVHFSRDIFVAEWIVSDPKYLVINMLELSVQSIMTRYALLLLWN